jgi:hypothetical protein
MDTKRNSEVGDGTRIQKEILQMLEESQIKRLQGKSDHELSPKANLLWQLQLKTNISSLSFNSEARVQQESVLSLEAILA